MHRRARRHRLRRRRRAHQLVHDPLRTPLRVRAPQLTHPRLHLRRGLVRARPRPLRPVRQPRQPRLAIARHPRMHRLARHAHLGGHLAHRARRPTPPSPPGTAARRPTTPPMPIPASRAEARKPITASGVKHVLRPQCQARPETGQGGKPWWGGMFFTYSRRPSARPAARGSLRSPCSPANTHDHLARSEQRSAESLGNQLGGYGINRPTTNSSTEGGGVAGRADRTGTPAPWRHQPERTTVTGVGLRTTACAGPGATA